MVNKTEHHVVPHHFIAMDGGNVETRRFALVVVEVVADMGAEDFVFAWCGGQNGVNLT